ncbi:extracellular solute-binding protein [Agrobacterium rhizogenes]|uniref:extracellular solute-binding protein n=1 Tax=Rhizobium rhizogenes TaxID=359 RepID=UPI0022B63AEF|nr:extracellular solute-binding protein [Rhizobium rhizogenes]MCZ7450279.1 extracellular solute-binding protein [Rhizobium rhizogenes]
MFTLNRRHFMAGASATLIAGTGMAWGQDMRALRVIALPSIFAGMYGALRDQFLLSGEETLTLDTSIREDEAAVAAILRSALTGDLPDILFISPNYLRVFVERNLAQPLNAQVAADADWNSSYSETITRIGDVSGKIYGLGFAISMPVLLFNRDLMQRAGIVDVPRNWSEVIEAGRRMDALGGGDTLGAFMEYDNGGNWTFHGLLNGFGGRILDPSGRIGFAGQEGHQALDLLRSFGEAGQARADMSRDQARQAFSAGKLGILGTSSSSFSAIENRAGGRFAITMVPFPIPSPAGRLPAAGPVAIMFSRDPERQRRAFQFMSFASGIAGQTIMARNTAYLPANRLALQSDELARFYADRPSVASLVPALSKMGPWEAFPGENTVKITDAIKRHLASVVLLKAPVDAALAAMAAEVSALLPKA